MKARRLLSVRLAGTAFAILALLRLYARDADDEDQKAAVTAPSRLSMENGQTVITLDAASQKRLGLAVTALRPMSARNEVVVAATILPTQDLLTLRSAYIGAHAQVEKAQASVNVSGEEYHRLKKLYDEHQDASQKSVEAAAGAVHTDQATLSAAEQVLLLQRFAVQQSWGATVAGWVIAGRPELARVLDGSSLLVQVTFPPKYSFPPSGHITLSTPGGPTVDANYLSLLPRINPQVQRASFIYMTKARPSLAPGMNLVARLPEGSLQNGVLIPYSAVVWWQGEGWVYKRLNSTRFVRKPIGTETPLKYGYFTITGFSAQEQVVVRGAQFLLSEEFRSQIQAQD